MTTKLLLAGALIALLILPAGAQQAPQGAPTRIRGTVEKLDGEALTVKSREGQTVTIVLADNVALRTSSRRTSDISSRATILPRPA